MLRRFIMAGRQSGCGVLFRGLIVLMAIAQQGVPLDAARSETKYSKIVLNPSTNTSFQFVLHDLHDSKNWEEARRLAAKLTYKNVQGRLAVVTDPQINRFLYQTFKPKTETWIGLRYFCGFGKSLWVDGNVLSRASFNNWARVWYRNQKITCNSQRGAFEYMPVYYTPLERGFRWQASGPQKKFYSYFVEYAHKS